MADFAAIVTAVGGLTVLTTIQQLVTGALDERRKNTETKRADAAAKREGRREPLVRRHLELGNLTDAEALADRQTARLVRDNERLVKQAEDRQVELEAKDTEILRQRGEIAQLYRELYNSDPRHRRPPGT